MPKTTSAAAKRAGRKRAESAGAAAETKTTSERNASRSRTVAVAKPNIRGGERENGEQREQREQRPILKRKLDLLYLIFFVVHVPVMLVVDLVSLYPPSLTPTFMLDLRAYYIRTYADRFFTAQGPDWFVLYMWMEAGIHVPVSLWAVGGLWRDDPHTALYLLPFAVQTFVTTLTCISEMLSWPLSAEQKLALASLYVPYWLLAAIMTIDTFFRLKNKFDS